MMTSKEKYLAKIASKESKAVIDAKERLKNEKWLKESKRLALRILLRLDELKLTQKNFSHTDYVAFLSAKQHAFAREFNKKDSLWKSNRSIRNACYRS